MKERVIPAVSQSELNMTDGVAVIRGRGSCVEIKGKKVWKGCSYATVIRDPTSGKVDAVAGKYPVLDGEPIGIDDLDKFPELAGYRDEIETALRKATQRKKENLKAVARA